MPFYKELTHFLTKDKTIETLHTYSTTRGQEELLVGTLTEKEAQ